MKFYNKKILSLLATGFVLISLTGCSNDLDIFRKDAIIINQNDQKSNDNVQENTNVNSSNSNNVVEGNNREATTNTNSNNSTSGKEENIIEYFEKLESQTTEILNSKNVSNAKEKVSEFFINIIDFIFYDKEINGVKYDELTNDAKLEILKIAQRMDTSIENKFPNYKEKISSTSKDVYSKVSDKVKEGIDYLGDKTEEKIGTDNYNNLQDSYEDMKDSTKNAIDVVGDNVTMAKEKVKTWYENKTGK